MMSPSSFSAGLEAHQKAEGVDPWFCAMHVPARALPSLQLIYMVAFGF